MLIQPSRFLRHPVFATSLLFAGMLTATGAFGTFRIVLPLRLVYWAIITFSAAGSLVAGDRVLSRYFRRAFVRKVATVIVAALPTTLVAAMAAIALRGPTSVRGLLTFYPAALVLNLLLLALWRLSAKPAVLVSIAATVRPDDTVPSLLGSKLPPKLSRSRLVVVEAQDHYLRVATRDGQALVHMRFADALRALEKSDGARVHRSWWVARQSIETMRFASGRGELTLHDGTVVPVSRTFAARAKEMARRPSSNSVPQAETERSL